MKYLIWSIEHNAWWAPNSRGYSTELSGAGIYERNEASKIIRGANRCGETNECMIPVAAMLSGLHAETETE